MLRFAVPSLVVLVGASGSGKSWWAAEHLPEGHVVSSDRLRAVVGESEHDQRASTDAFDVLDLIVARRLRRGLPTVIDSLALDAKRRRRWVALAREHGVPAHAVVFATPAEICRARNAQRARKVPANVLIQQLRSAAGVTVEGLLGEGFTSVHPPGDGVRFVDADMVDAPDRRTAQQEDPVPLAFGLQLPSFTWPGGPAEVAARLGDLAATAEQVGFSSIWVMDHMLQIPQVGPVWQDMLDSYTTLGFLAGRTHTARLGALVTAITYRNLAHLAKIVATLDVLSGGRAMCGLGLGWYEREHRAYGWTFPSVGDRYALLEDALGLLPAMWGRGAPRYEGRTTVVEEAMCYPRPLQERLPILVGGSGERRTLRLVARHADACNLFGDAATVRRKVEVLHGHCRDVGRDPAEVTVTQLSQAFVTDDPDAIGPDSARLRIGAGTVEDQIGRYRTLADAGVQMAIVSLPEVAAPGQLDRFGEVIDAFRR